MKKADRSVLFAVTHEVDSELQQQFGKQFWKITELDKLRLLKLKVWGVKYRVTLGYILGVVMTFYWDRLPKQVREKVKGSRSLGVRIATLVSKGSEKALVDAIARDFPNGENISVYKEEERNRIAALLDEEDNELPVARTKAVLSYKTMSAFVESYTRKVASKKRAMAKLETKMKKMPWRENPWR